MISRTALANHFVQHNSQVQALTLINALDLHKGGGMSGMSFIDTLGLPS